MDDYSSDVETEGTIEVGGTATGEIEEPRDVDWFATTLEAGVEYSIRQRGTFSDGGSLRDPFVFVFNAAGEEIASRDDTFDLEPQLYFTPETTGTYYIGAGGFGGDVGTYTLSLEITPPDIPNSAATEAELTFGEPFSSDFRDPYDADWFRFQSDEGAVYRLEVSVEDDDQALFVFVDLLDGDGEWIAGTWLDNDANSGTFAGPVTGPAYIAVANDYSSAMDYTVTLTPVTDDPNDVPGDDSTEEVLEIDVPRDGTFELSGDRDVYAVMLEGGEPYRFDLTPPSGQDYLNAQIAAFELLDPSGELVATAGWAENRDGYVIDGITPPSDGTYYLAVTGSSRTGLFTREEAYGIVALSLSPIIATGTEDGDEIRGGIGDDQLFGLGRGDLIVASEGDDLIEGGAGNDSLFGQLGNDTILGGTGDDDIAGADGRDLISGGAGNDTIGGGEGRDVIDGGEGNDFIAAGSSADLIEGGLGADSLIGGRGRDTVRGGDGDDVMSGGFADDVLLGGAGSDEIGGGSGADVIYAGLGDDTVGGGFDADLIVLGAGDDSGSGGQGADTLIGGVGSDVLEGGYGSDRLEGGAGDDTLTGGENGDTFVFDASSEGGADVVTDFFYEGAGDGDDYYDYYYYYDTLPFDRLDIHGIDGAQDDPEAALDALDISVTDAGLLVDYGTGTVLLQGVTDASVLGIDNVIFV
ncbi:Hemolysin-type calcium-binding repeat-containing protein [Roseivivax marinus]|uniref:calcium-binding protein n=1 Tax=Roseivivax marinus TaxID=1379903 RepID=UPI0008B6E902|nr:calcium-binding protein [Roseivivax marinus]SEL14474.1 Hemolysin-type calcium-binding repeat-containing protein [Roseivivax marinus]